MAILCLARIGRCSSCYFKCRQLHASSSMKNKFLFTEKHHKLRKKTKTIIEKEINPYVDEWEKEKRIPLRDIYRKFADAQHLGITKQIEYGGLGLDYSYKVAYIESLREVNCMSIPFSLLAFDIANEGLAKFGNQEQKNEFLSPSLKGERISCIGINEVQNIATTAVKKGDDLILNGGKMWVVNGPQADWMLLLANTDEVDSRRNKSLICVPLDATGTSCRQVPLMGSAANIIGQFIFENVKVPSKYIIGEEGMGREYAMNLLQDERLSTSIYASSMQERIIEMTAAFCREQEREGIPLIDNQMIHYTLAELQTEIEAFRSLLYRTAAQKMKGVDYSLLASMAKLKGGRLTRKVTDECLQHWGFIGASDESLIGRFYRDIRSFSIAGEPDEYALRLISKPLCNF